jgi:hypothetical protein
VRARCDDVRAEEGRPHHVWHGPRTHTALPYTNGAEARQDRGERMSSIGKRRSSCAACRTTVCREVTRGAGGAAVRRLRADPHGSSEAARGGRRRPSRRRQRKAWP